MECSGVIAGVGPGVIGWQVGDQVCALLAGGGYAERVAVPAAQVLPVPDGVDLVDRGRPARGGLHGVVQPGDDRRPARAADRADPRRRLRASARWPSRSPGQEGAMVAVTASRPDALRGLPGAGRRHRRSTTREQDFVAELQVGDRRPRRRHHPRRRRREVPAPQHRRARRRRPAGDHRDAGRHHAPNWTSTRCCASGRASSPPRCAPGRSPAPVPRARSSREVRERLWPMIAAGDVRPVIDSVIDMRDAGAAHRRLAEGGHVGKIVLRVPGRQSPTSRN